MYKKVKHYDDMVRLVKQYHPDLLSKTHLHLGKVRLAGDRGAAFFLRHRFVLPWVLTVLRCATAQELEEGSHFGQAEHHYVCAEDWKSAVNMYRGREMWDDAHRVAKAHGGNNAAQQVCVCVCVCDAGANLWRRPSFSFSSALLFFKRNN